MTSRFAPAADVEVGNSPTVKMRSGHARRSKRQLGNSFPVGAAVSFAFVFLVFVLVGMLRASRHHGPIVPKTLGGNPMERVNTGQPNLFTYSIVAEFDHDATAFTQGLEVLRGQVPVSTSTPGTPTFIESTGLRGQSTVREVNISTGQVLRSTRMVDQDFGEGITRLGSKLYQVTWQGPKMIAYSVEDFSDTTTMSTHLADGWGITNDGSNLIVGDSTSSLYYIDPKTTNTIKRIEVTDDGRPIRWLNELEWVDGLIYANIWQKECIAQIEPTTGNVVGWVDLSGLTDQVKMHSPGAPVDVLNGIAYDEVDGKLYVTGKLWPKLYEIQLRPLYVDSKKTNVDEMTADIRRRCIVS